MRTLLLMLLCVSIIWNIVATEKIINIKENLKNSVIKFNDQYYLCQKLEARAK